MRKSAENLKIAPFSEASPNAQAPLAERMRPRTLDEFVGQKLILGTGRLLRRAIEADRLSSVLFSGPPGTGKTTLARIIANTTQANFIAINAVLAGIKEIREAIDFAKEAKSKQQRRTLLFIDEVHRFNKVQQDALLPHVENGTLTLIGATTENPFFEVNKALVSRSRIFQLRPLEEEDIRKALEMALLDGERGYGKRDVLVDPNAMDHWVRMAQGDARSALNALELAVETTRPNIEGNVLITLAVAEDSMQRKAVLYDKDGDAHYDSISAFIKSIRGSDPDAALYWLAKMIEAGEDSRFLFRRMVISASEDIGLADPNALGVVMASAQAFEYVGMPEGQFHLSQACLYLATAPKSNSTMALFEAQKTIREEKVGDVPNALKDPSRDGDEMGHGKGYQYPHAFRDHWVAQQYLPTGLQGKLFYEPSDQGYESSLREDVWRRREAQRADSTPVEEFPSSGISRSGNDWLQRAVGVGHKAMKQMRDDLCELAGLRRETLALDLGTTAGFLSWEALRRCVEGGVWSRCENGEEAKAMESWSQRLGSLGQPKIWQAPWNRFLQEVQALPERPLFNVILGANIPIPSGSWMAEVSPFLGPEAKWALAYRRTGLPNWPEWLAGAPQSWTEKAQAFSQGFLEKANQAAKLTVDLQEQRGWQVKTHVRHYSERRSLTSTEIGDWLSRSTQKPESLFSLLHEKMREDWSELMAHIIRNLTRGPADFQITYDMVLAVYLSPKV